MTAFVDFEDRLVGNDWLHIALLDCEFGERREDIEFSQDSGVDLQGGCLRVDQLSKFEKEFEL